MSEFFVGVAMIAGLLCAVAGACLRAVEDDTMGRKEPGWISVEDRMPEVFQDVLVTIKTPYGTHVSVLKRHPQAGFWEQYDGDVDDINVTHWMPLPVAAKDSK